MAQTTAAIDRSNYEVGIADDAATWVTIEGQAVTVTVSDGDQLIGEQFTAEGEVPIVTGANKMGARTVTVTCVYTEEALEAFEKVYARYTGAAKTIAVRWAPKGGIGTVAGNNIFTTSTAAGAAAVAPIINCTLPDLDASSADPAIFEFSVRAADILEGVTVTS
jgi:hypothetical protein